ncbi:MAG: phytanoyl-CoA dioxygenase family protein [Cryomorphaceae bacterium]
MTKSYGINIEKGNEEILFFEELERKGVTIQKGVFDKSKMAELCRIAEEICAEQVKSFGQTKLEQINEADLVRCPLVSSNEFLELVLVEPILSIVDRVIGSEFHLHLQNCVINRSKREHHQSSWHRDLPYQNWVCSKTLSINAFICLSPFNPKTGGTQFVLGSHLHETIPSESYLNENLHVPEAEAGDVLFFNSMVLHRAGQNTSKGDRYGVNQVFTIPIIKQQIDLTSVEADDKFDQSLISKVLGQKYQVPHSVQEFRENRFKKINSK